MKTILYILTCLLLIALLTGWTQEEVLIKGSVTLDGDPYPGCPVKILEYGVTQVTDANGGFAFSVIKKQKRITVTVSSPEPQFSATTSLENISVDGELDLRNLPVILNKSISVEQYARLSLFYQLDYQPMRCWADVIAYYHKHEIDSVALTIPCDKEGRDTLPWKYEREGNKIRIDFADWKKCR